ncbi:MAG: ComF family protein [Planctomycetaceae bacterium]|nr:ComF family protein [Planctomycetaceae bacterium]
MKASLLGQVVSSAIDFVYPPSCGLCQGEIETVDALHPLLCEECFRKLDPGDDRGCPACGAKLGPFAPDRPECVHCRNERYAFTEVYSLGNYGDALQQICISCKSRSSHPLTLQMADLLSRIGNETLASWDVDLVACVPHHWRKRLWDRYHCSAELAERVAGNLGKPFARHLLTKTRHTPDQARLAPTQRRKNVKNSFAVSSRHLVRDRRILLVDDVMTTGSTADACTRALKKAGAEAIFVSVLARGLG